MPDYRLPGTPLALPATRRHFVELTQGPGAFQHHPFSATPGVATQGTFSAQLPTTVMESEGQSTTADGGRCSRGVGTPAAPSAAQSSSSASHIKTFAFLATPSTPTTSYATDRSEGSRKPAVVGQAGTFASSSPTPYLKLNLSSSPENPQSNARLPVLEISDVAVETLTHPKDSTLTLLASGRYAHVYSMELQPGIRYALKVTDSDILSPNNGSDEGSRIARDAESGQSSSATTEALILASLRHPNLLRLYAVFANNFWHSSTQYNMCYDNCQSNLNATLRTQALLIELCPLGSLWDFTCYSEDSPALSSSPATLSTASATGTITSPTLGVTTALQVPPLLPQALVTRMQASSFAATFMRWAAELASAVEYLHSKSIVHHDIKPHNVLVTNTLSIRLSDFGSSVFANNAHESLKKLPSENGLGRGTTAYLAPELACVPLPETYDGFCADMYSTAATLYVVGYLGRAPFRRIRRPVQLLLVVSRGLLNWEDNTLPPITDGMQPALRAATPSFDSFDTVSDILWKAILSCLSVNPTERRSAKDFYEIAIAAASSTADKTGET